jgi:hypothetical protein
MDEYALRNLLLVENSNQEKPSVAGVASLHKNEVNNKTGGKMRSKVEEKLGEKSEKADSNFVTVNHFDEITQEDDPLLLIVKPLTHNNKSLDFACS